MISSNLGANENVDPTESNSPWNLIQTRLAVRLTLMFVLVAVIPMAVITVISIQKASSALTDFGLESVEQATEQNNKELVTFLGQFFTDVRTFSDTPPVQGVIRARDNGGIDPKSSDPFEVWVNRLTQIFAAAARNKEFYQQLRYINEDGDEMVRVDYKNGTVDLVSGTDRLQNKKTSSYFTGVENMGQGDVFISALNLNKEGGNIQVPHVPVVRFSTPVHDPSGAFRGAIVSNVYAESFLGRLNSDSGSIMLATEDGSLALHPDPDKTFGSDLGTRFSINTEFGDQNQLLADSGSDSIVETSDSLGEVVSLQMVKFDPANPDRHWLIARALPTSEVLGPVTDMRTW